MHAVDERLLVDEERFRGALPRPVVLEEHVERAHELGRVPRRTRSAARGRDPRPPRPRRGCVAGTEACSLRSARPGGRDCARRPRPRPPRGPRRGPGQRPRTSLTPSATSGPTAPRSVARATRCPAARRGRARTAAGRGAGRLAGRARGAGRHPPGDPRAHDQDRTVGADRRGRRSAAARARLEPALEQVHEQLASESGVLLALGGDPRDLDRGDVPGVAEQIEVGTMPSGLSATSAVGRTAGTRMTSAVASSCLIAARRGTRRRACAASPRDAAAQRARHRILRLEHRETRRRIEHEDPALELCLQLRSSGPPRRSQTRLRAGSRTASPSGRAEDAPRRSWRSLRPARPPRTAPRAGSRAPGSEARRPWRGTAC